LTSEQSRVAETQTAEVQSALKTEWGSQYDQNIKMITGHLGAKLGEDAVQKLNSAVLSDGTFLVNDAKILNHFLAEAKAGGGNHTLTSSQGNDYVSLSARRDQLEKIASTPGSDWFNRHNERLELAEIVQAMADKK